MQPRRHYNVIRRNLLLCRDHTAAAAGAAATNFSSTRVSTATCWVTSCLKVEEALPLAGKAV